MKTDRNKPKPDNKNKIPDLLMRGAISAGGVGLISGAAGLPGEPAAPAQYRDALRNISAVSLAVAALLVAAAGIVSRAPGDKFRGVMGGIGLGFLAAFIRNFGVEWNPWVSVSCALSGVFLLGGNLTPPAMREKAERNIGRFADNVKRKFEIVYYAFAKTKPLGK